MDRTVSELCEVLDDPDVMEFSLLATPRLPTMLPLEETPLRLSMSASMAALHSEPFDGSVSLFSHSSSCSPSSSSSSSSSSSPSFSSPSSSWTTT